MLIWGIWYLLKAYLLIYRYLGIQVTMYVINDTFELSKYKF